MVLMATGLGRTGLQDWLIQRVTAVIMAAYTILLSWFMMQRHPMTILDWQALFSVSLMRYATLCALISIVMHAWVGIWTVFTDYIKPLYLRLPLQVLAILFLLSQLFWGVHILWGR